MDIRSLEIDFDKKILKKKWKKLKKRIADLEGQVQSQQEEITAIRKKIAEMNSTKSGGTRYC